MVQTRISESLMDIKFDRQSACSPCRWQSTREGQMATEDLEQDVPEEPIPAMQQLLDNPFLLLFLGVAIPTVLYIVWGVMEIVSLPIAK